MFKTDLVGIYSMMCDHHSCDSYIHMSDRSNRYMQALDQVETEAFCELDVHLNNNVDQVKMVSGVTCCILNHGPCLYLPIINYTINF